MVIEYIRPYDVSSMVRIRKKRLFSTTVDDVSSFLEIKLFPCLIKAFGTQKELHRYCN